MIPQTVQDILKKQHYRMVGNHSAVQVCRWTKKSLRGEGVCYKEQFYGIKSHLCCQMTPSAVWCPNRCVHCWRAIEHTIGIEPPREILNSPKEIVDGCIEAQKKLIEGFKILPETKGKTCSKVNMEKFSEAQEPTSFAISLAGEPTAYRDIGGLIEELRKRRKTSFLVTSGLYPEKLEELLLKKQLPTQLYISVNVPKEDMYQKFHNSSFKDAWQKLMQSLEVMNKAKGKTRTVFRMNLVRGWNMESGHAIDFAQLIQKANPDFIEVKGFMSVGFSRKRLGYERMPRHSELKEFSKNILEELGREYTILDEKMESCVLVLGKDKSKLKIIPTEI